MKRYAKSICDNSKKRYEIRGNNFMTPRILGYYKGVEISEGDFMGRQLVGVTFTTDLNHPLNDYNKCFSEGEATTEEIREYINSSLK